MSPLKTLVSDGVHPYLPLNDQNRLTINAELIKSNLIQSLIWALFPRGPFVQMLINFLKRHQASLLHYHLIISERNNHPPITLDDQEIFNQDNYSLIHQRSCVVRCRVASARVPLRGAPACPPRGHGNIRHCLIYCSGVIVAEGNHCICLHFLMVFQQLLHKQPFLILMTEKMTSCVFTRVTCVWFLQQDADKSSSVSWCL